MRGVLSRGFAAWRLVLFLWVVQLCVTFVAGLPVRGAVGAATSGHQWMDESRQVAAVAELLGAHPSVVATVMSGWISTIAASGLFWVLAGGAILAHLGGERGASTLAAAAFRWSLPLTVQTCWALAGRAVCIGIAVLATTPLDGARIPAIALGYAVAQIVFDRARVSVVLEHGSRFGPRPYVKSTWAILQAPLRTCVALVLFSAQWVLLLASAFMVFSDSLGDASIWVARILALPALMFGMLRLSLWIEPERTLRA